LFEVGIGLEVWVSSLVKNAGSASLRVVTTSKGIALLRDRPDRGGEAHTGEEERGNPHVWLDPENAMTMMRHITEALIQVDPAHATEYRTNQAAYLRKLDQLRQDLSDRITRLVDRRFVAHHPAWPYLARRFGFQIVGTIQPQSGSEPSALQLHGLIAKIKNERIKVVVSEIQLSQKIPDLLAKETGARVVVLTTLTGGLPNTETYIDMLRYNVLQLTNALEGT
jgi:ABC-type Zn uptake system ZnuABC Zn-binding protein ZnuA